jgi:hypothetical protein
VQKNAAANLAFSCRDKKLAWVTAPAVHTGANADGADADGADEAGGIIGHRLSEATHGQDGERRRRPERFQY